MKKPCVRKRHPGRWVVACGGVVWWAGAACGGTTSQLPLEGPGDASIDAQALDAIGTSDAPVVADSAPEGGPVGAADGSAPDVVVADAGTDASPLDAGASCAPPSDPNKSALCVVVSPEAIGFVAGDPSFDGKGVLAVDVHAMADPNGPDGGSLPALQGTTSPAPDAGGPEVDLSAPLPPVRFDGLAPGVVYPRAIFVDSRDTNKVGAGWWLGGYDLARGLRTPALLRPVTLTAGVGTTVVLNLTALRALGVTLTRSAAPIGNAQGPAVVAVTPDLIPGDASALFGAATAPCANLAPADAAAAANGFVFGTGPYYAVAVLDDFSADASISLPPGSLTSLTLRDGGLTSPPSARLAYAPGDYVVGKALDLDLAIPLPDAGPDPVSCP